jgi:signal transduction histidine kinase
LKFPLDANVEYRLASFLISLRMQRVEQMMKVFERFYRAVDASTSGIPGLGIGLYLVAEIIKHHGGTITVESAVGQGSAFHVTLPLSRHKSVET